MVFLDGAYHPWAELLARTFALDVLQCPTCYGRMKLLAIVTPTKSIARYLANIGEPVGAPSRAQAVGPRNGKAPSCVATRSARKQAPPITSGLGRGPRGQICNKTRDFSTTALLAVLDGASAMPLRCQSDPRSAATCA
ncbi:MAG TPA: hypothetical protein VJT73_11390 [Polyangiaceae bacterium]|nr:hypothetical protein [Polyangiaceae bacterium]